MDYRNRYRRGGIVGLAEGGSWLDRFKDVMTLSGEEIKAKKLKALMDADWADRRRQNPNVQEAPPPTVRVGDPAHVLDLSDPNLPREQRGNPGPNMSAIREAQLGTFKQDPTYVNPVTGKEDNRRQLMRMRGLSPEEGGVTEEQYQKSMDYLNFGPEGRPRPEAPLPAVVEAVAAALDPMDSLARESHFEDLGHSPEQLSGAEKAREMESRRRGAELEARNLKGGSAPAWVKEQGVTEDIWNSLTHAQRSELEPPAKSIREEMEDPYTWRVGGDHGVPGSFTNDAMIQEALREREMPDPLAGLMMSPDAPQSREDILADMALRNSLEFGETNDPLAGLDFDPGNPLSNLDSLAEDPISGAMSSSEYPPVLQDLIFEDMDPGMMEREYPPVLQDLIFEDMDPGMMEREYPPVLQDLIFEDMDPGMMEAQGERSPVLRTMDQLDPEEIEIYNMIMQSDAPDQMKYQMYTQLLSRSYGGAIPGYGVGGFLGKALATVAGGIHPALGAGVGGIASLFSDPGEGGSRTKNFFKSALAGGLGGIGTSNIFKGGLGGFKDFKNLAGYDKLTGFDKLKSLASNVGRGLGEGVDDSIEAYSDPKILGLAAPMLGQLMDKNEGTPQAQGNQAIFDNTSSAVVGGSANPANWKDGRYIGNAQGNSMEGLANGGYLSGYENGGEYGDEYDEPTYYRPPQRKKKVTKQSKKKKASKKSKKKKASKQPKPEQWQLPPDPGSGGDQPIIDQVRDVVPNTAAAAPRRPAPVEAPPENVEPVAPPRIVAPPPPIAPTPIEAPPENVEPALPPRIVAPPPPPRGLADFVEDDGGDEYIEDIEPALPATIAALRPPPPPPVAPWQPPADPGAEGEPEPEQIYTPPPPVAPWQLPPDPSLTGGDEPVIDQVRSAVPNTAANYAPEPWQLPPDPSLTGGDASTDASSAAAAEAAAEAVNEAQRLAAAASNNQVENPYGPPLGDNPTQAQIDKRNKLIAEEMRKQQQKPDPALEHPVGADPTHGLDDGGERPEGFVDQTTLSPTEDPTKQYIESKFTTAPAVPAAPTAPAVPAAPAVPVGNAGAVADHQDYVAGYDPERSRTTGEGAVNPVGLNPMKPQDQSALSEQQQKFIAGFGKAEGGELALREPPQQIRSIVKKALNGELSSAQVNVEKVLSEINATYPGLIEEVANEIRAERQQQGGGPPVVREGYIPPFNDGMPESSGRVDDRAAAVLPSSDTGISAGLERSLAKGGKIPMGAVVAPHEYILDKEDTAENITNLKAAVNYVAKRNPKAKGPQMWNATRKHMDIGRVKNA